MKTEFYFRQLDQQFAGYTKATEVALTGSVPAWQCGCYHWNGEKVPSCNNCGTPKPAATEERQAA